MILIFSIIGQISWAQSSLQLRSAIQLRDDKRPDLIYSTSGQNEVDVNSSITIKFNQPAILNALQPLTTKSNMAAIEYNNKIEQLNELISLLSVFTARSQKLLDAGKLTEQEWKEYAKAGMAFNNSFSKYLSIAPNGKEMRANYSKLISQPLEAAKYINKVFKDNIEELNKMNLDVTEGQSKISFTLYGNYYSAEGEKPLNIPGYFNNEVDRPSKIDKIRFNFTSEEKEAVKKNADAIISLNKIQSDYKSIIASFSDEIYNVVTSFEKTETTLQKLLDYDLSKLPKIETLKDFLDAIPENNSLRKKIKDIYEPIKAFYTDITKLESIIRTNIAECQSIYDNLKSNNVNTASSAMFTILDLVTDLPSKLNSTISLIGQLSSNFSEIQNRLKSFSDSDFLTISKIALDKIMSTPEVASFFNKLKDFKTSVDSFIAAVADTKDTYLGPLLKSIMTDNNKKSAILQQVALSMDLTPEILNNIQTHSPDELLDTSINLQDYKNRKEGDYVKIRLLIKNGTSVLLDDQYTVHVFRAGIYSDLYTGLIYVKRNEQPNYYPTVGVSWMLKIWCYPDNSWRYFWHSFGLGFHTTTLVIDQNKIQLGIGLSAHLLDNLIQFGTGWNLGANGSPYYYIGFGLIELLNVSKQ